MFRILSLLSEMGMKQQVCLLAAALFDMGLIYGVIFYPSSDTGFYSWHPIKRLLAVIFFPFIVVYRWAMSLTDEEIEFLLYYCDDDDD